MTITVTQTDGEWEVWLALTDHDPTKVSESFIIGCSMHRREATEQAIRTLREAAVELERQRKGSGPWTLTTRENA